MTCVMNTIISVIFSFSDDIPFIPGLSWLRQKWTVSELNDTVGYSWHKYNPDTVDKCQTKQILIPHIFLNIVSFTHESHHF